MQGGEPHGPTEWLYGRVLRVETEEMIKSDVSGRMPGTGRAWMYRGFTRGERSRDSLTPVLAYEDRRCGKGYTYLFAYKNFSMPLFMANRAHRAQVFGHG
jgi:hypothetical protein